MARPPRSPHVPSSVSCPSGGHEGPPPQYTIKRKGPEELDAKLTQSCSGRAAPDERGKVDGVPLLGEEVVVVGRLLGVAPVPGRGWGCGDAPAAEPASLRASMGRVRTGRPCEQPRCARRRRCYRWCRQRPRPLLQNIRRRDGCRSLIRGGREERGQRRHICGTAKDGTVLTRSKIMSGSPPPHHHLLMRSAVALILA